jgi:putative acetyltransferase
MKPKIVIRPFHLGDEAELRAIFFNTIRQINIRDYSQEQVQAWAPKAYDKTQWQVRISKINPFIAELDSTIVGYADIQGDGYIDHFFCHHLYQGKGVARALMQCLITKARHEGIEHIYSHASITARPFFEHFGFQLVKQQTVDIRGVTLTNFVMEKFL